MCSTQTADFAGSDTGGAQDGSVEDKAVVPAKRYIRIAAAGVHVFTALGAVCGLFAALAAFDGAWVTMFAWLGVALIIDGIDGLFARLANVEERLPRFSGERLDLVVDYITYVFVPALALVRAGFLDGPAGLMFAAAILLSSLFHFSDVASKSDDNSFVGFPATWNIIAFYLFAFAPSGAVTYAIIGLCVALTFVPLRWAHPFRVVRLRPLTLSVTLLWAIATAGTLLMGFPAPGWCQAILLGAAAYLAGLALMRAPGRS